MAAELRPDIQAAKDRLRVRMGAGREFKKLAEHLREGEMVELLCVGISGHSQGLLALTNTRLLFLTDGLTGGSSEEFPLDGISLIQWAKGSVTGTITIFTSGTKAEVKSVNVDDGKVFTDRVQAIITAYTNTGPVAAAQQQPLTQQLAAPPESYQHAGQPVAMSPTTNDGRGQWPDRRQPNVAAPSYVVLQVILKEKMWGTGSGNLTELERAINAQAVLGYRLHTITTAASGSKGLGGGDRIQATMVFERI